MKKLLCILFGCKYPDSYTVSECLDAIIRGFTCVRCGKVYPPLKIPPMPPCKPAKQEN
jgi:hypothetical protein